LLVLRSGAISPFQNRSPVLILATKCLIEIAPFLSFRIIGYQRFAEHRGQIRGFLTRWIAHDAVCKGIAIDEFASWINSNLPYCFVSFFQNQTAINICCSDNPKMAIYSRLEPAGLLFSSGQYVGSDRDSLNSKKLALFVSGWRRKVDS
jgi:hypothetical protein